MVYMGEGQAHRGLASPLIVFFLVFVAEVLKESSLRKKITDLEYVNNSLKTSKKALQDQVKRITESYRAEESLSNQGRMPIRYM